MEIPSHPGRWENVFRSNLYLRLAESTIKKIFCEKVVLSKKFEKRGGEKMVIPGHSGGLGKIFSTKMFLGLAKNIF